MSVLMLGQLALVSTLVDGARTDDSGWVAGERGALLYDPERPSLFMEMDKPVRSQKLAIVLGKALPELLKPRGGGEEAAPSVDALLRGWWDIFRPDGNRAVAQRFLVETVLGDVYVPLLAQSLGGARVFNNRTPRAWQLKLWWGRDETKPVATWIWDASVAYTLRKP